MRSWLVMTLVLVAGCAGPRWSAPPGLPEARIRAAADSLGVESLAAADAPPGAPNRLEVVGWVIYYGLDVVPAGHRLVTWAWTVPETGSQPVEYLVLERRVIPAMAYPVGSGARELMYAVVPRSGEAVYELKVAAADSAGRTGPFSEPGRMGAGDEVDSPWWEETTQ